MPNKIVKFYLRKQYGRVDYYIQDKQIAEVIADITREGISGNEREWAISPRAMEALKKIGYTFKNIIDPYGRKPRGKAKAKN